MPTITIRDEQGTELLSSDLSGEGLGKYIRTAASLRSVLPLGRVLSEPLTEGNGGRELRLALDKEVPVGKNSELSISASAGVAVGVHPPGGTIFAGSDLQAPVAVPNGTAYSSLTLEALLKAGLAGTKGNVGFGFEAGTALRYAYFHPFDIAGRAESVGGAIKTMLSAAVFPADADDLARLPVGAFASLAGEGELSFSAQASLSSTTNLLATPGLPLIGSVALVQAASLTVGAEWTASGEFELRVSKPTATQVRLSFYRRRGRSLSVSAKALAGVSAQFRGRDLLATLMKAISADPEADLLTLVNAGLDDAAIEAIQQAVAASIDRSLTLSAQFQLSALREDEALFSYDVELSRLDQAGKAAMGEAMHGRLAAIGQAADVANGPIRLVASAAKQLRERKTSWRINVLGILNVASFVELVREGTVTFDPVSGALTAADKVSARRIRVKEKPFESDSEKLRKVLFESVMVTAAYQASRALGSTVSLTADHIYLEQRGRTKRTDIEDHYRALIALGLCDEPERDARLGAEPEFGSSTFVVENHFDAAACDAMFLEPGGQPHGAERYERIARQAFLALIPADDPARSFRRFALESDLTWARVRELGGALDHALPSHIRNEALRLAVVRGDVFTIVWWAKAMSKAATELVAMRTFLGQRKAETLAADQSFVKARNKLSEALGSVVARPRRASTIRGMSSRWTRPPRGSGGSRARSSRRGLRRATPRRMALPRVPLPRCRTAHARRVGRRRGGRRHEPVTRGRARLDRRGTRRVRAARRQPAQRQAVERGQLQLDRRAGAADLQRADSRVRGGAEGEGRQAARDVLRARRPRRRARGAAARAGAPALLGAERRLPGLFRLGDRAARDAAGHRRRRDPTGASGPRDAGRCGDRDAGAARREAGLGPDEEERRERRPGTAAARGWSRSWPRSSGRSSKARSSSTRSATAPVRSSTRSSCRSWSRRVRRACRR